MYDRTCAPMDAVCEAPVPTGELRCNKTRPVAETMNDTFKCLLECINLCGTISNIVGFSPDGIKQDEPQSMIHNADVNNNYAHYILIYLEQLRSKLVG